MPQPRAADDFAAIRARIEELRREREAIAAGSEIMGPAVPVSLKNRLAAPDKPMSPTLRRLLPRLAR
jgi:hypothetical protein